MALFPMERHMYSRGDNICNPLNATLQPSSRPSEDLTATWLDALGPPEYLLPFALQNMSLAMLALLALQKTSRSSTKSFLTPLARLLGRVGLYFVLMNVMKTLLGLVLLLAMTPVMLPFTVIFGATSLLVRLYYALRWGSDVKKVEGLDGVWGVEGEESKPFITVCLKVHGAPDLHKVKQAILTKVLQVRDKAGDYKYRKFRQLFSLRCGYYSWRDDPNFDINNHVREIELSSLLPEATSETTSETTSEDASEDASDDASKDTSKEASKDASKDASKEASETTSEAASEDTPEDTHDPDEDAADEDLRKAESEDADEQLQQYVSEALTAAMPEDIPPWEVILVARDDGRYNVLLRIHHAIADGVTLVRLCVEALVDTPLPPPPVGPPPPTPFVRFAFIMWSMLMLPFGIIKLMANTDKNCLHGPPLSGNKVMTWSKGMPLSVLRQVKNNASTTINDVLMSCLSAALAKHFARRKDDVQGVTVVVPVSFHDLRKPLVLTNMFSIATVKIPVGKALAPNARLKAVKEVLDATKKDPTLWAVHWVVKSASEVLPASVASLLFNSHGLTLAASNVPGPQQEITIWGDKVEDIMFWVPNRGPVGVGVSFFSYKGMVKVGLNVDLALIPSKAEAQQLLVDMEEELRILHGRLLPQA